jgi:hypothetical protein
MIDIDASGSTSINLGLKYRQSLNGVGIYDYDLSITSTPALDLECDTGNNRTKYYGACATSLFIRIPSFDRSIIADVRAMSWMVGAPRTKSPDLFTDGICLFRTLQLQLALTTPLFNF